jgi:hypothetical protein
MVGSPGGCVDPLFQSRDLATQGFDVEPQVGRYDDEHDQYDSSDHHFSRSLR